MSGEWRVRGRGWQRHVVRGMLRGVGWSLTALVAAAVTPPTWAQTPGETRFFADCPRRPYRRVHDETKPWDFHAIAYTALGMAELELLRMADWMIDLSVPARRVRPLHRSVQAIRSGYNRLPPWVVRQRLGELVDAFQMPELSLGDAAATYSAATGASRGPGSGMLIRAHKLVDWTQHVTGDLNRLAGRAVGRPHGLVPWSLPGRAVDGAQWAVLKLFNEAGELAGRAVDGTLTTVEMGVEELLNLGRKPPHQHTTVFLSLPLDVYRAHERWILAQRAGVVLGTREEFRQSTHAGLARRRRPVTPRDWDRVGWPSGEEPAVLMMTTLRVMARAPPSLKPYVVPAAWILNQPVTSGE